MIFEFNKVCMKNINKFSSYKKMLTQSSDKQRSIVAVKLRKSESINPVDRTSSKEENKTVSNSQIDEVIDYHNIDDIVAKYKFQAEEEKHLEKQQQNNVTVEQDSINRIKLEVKNEIFFDSPIPESAYDYTDYFVTKGEAQIKKEMDLKFEVGDDTDVFRDNYDLEMYEMKLKIEIEEDDMQKKCFGEDGDLFMKDAEAGASLKASTSKTDDESSNKLERTGKEIEDEDVLLSSCNKDSQESDTSNNQNEFSVQSEIVHKDKTNICHVCNKDFRIKTDLGRHLLIHSGVKSFTCEICYKSFTLKGNMVTHMLIHSGEKPHSCGVCKKNFRYKVSLDSHKLVHDGVKPFSCNECDKSFTRKHDLVAHKRIHTSTKPFVCDLCNKAFTLKTQLIRHRYIHTGEKPYSCDICNRPFVYKSTLTRHKKIHKH